MKRENSIDKSSQSYEWFEQQNTVVDTSLISISGYEWYSFHEIEPIVGPKIQDTWLKTAHTREMNGIMSE